MLLLGWYVSFSFAGFDKPVVVSVEDGMPMAEAGVQAGDEIVKINNTIAGCIFFFFITIPPS